MENDQLVKRIARLTTDFPYYCAQVFKIRKKIVGDAENELVRIPWHFNAVQTYLWEQSTDDDEILKMRAAGVSTYYQGLTVWAATSRKNTNCLVVVDRDDLSLEFYKTFTEFVGDLEDYYRSELEIEPPLLRQNNAKDGLWWADPAGGSGGLNSRIACVPAKSKGAGLGFTIDRVTFSEIGRYEEQCDPDRLFLRLNPAIQAKGKRTKESAAYGGSYWRELFRSNNGAKKHFIPWVANEDYTVALTREQAAKLTLSGSKESTWGDEVAMVSLIRDELKKWFPQKYGPTINPEGVLGNEFMDIEDPEKSLALEHEVRCRLAWRRWKIRKDCNNDWTGFAQQYPLTEEEAFLSAGNYALPQGKLAATAEVLENTPFPSKKFVFDTGFDSHDAAWWKTQIREVDEGGDIFIYEMYRPQFKYVLSCDPSEGIPDRDHGSIRVWRLPERVEVLAYDKSTDPYELADLAYAISQMYGNCLMGVELRGVGFAVVRRLMDGNYYYPNPRPRLFTSEFSINRADPVLKFGFDTNRGTKKGMVEDLAEAIREDSVVFTHLRTVDECRNYVKVPTPGGSVKYNCGKKPDNAVIASMIALQLSKHAGDYWQREESTATSSAKQKITLAEVARFMRNCG